jgi:MFS family permease
VLTTLGLLIAVIVQPLAGALSDRWTSPWGRRRPLIALGSVLDLPFLAFLGWAGGLGWLALGYIGLQLSSNLAHGPLQGLMPDVVPKEQHGRASGIKNLMDMGGLVAASLLVGRLLRPEERHPVGVVALIAAVLGLSAAITLFGVREAPSGLTSAEHKGDEGRLSLALLRQITPAYRWLIASRFFFLAGVYGIQTFAQYYVRDVLAVPNPIKLTGDLLASITLALIFFAVLGGWIGDRVGHRRMLSIASGIGALGCLSLLAGRTPATLLAFGSVLGVGIGLFLTSNWALANQLAPPEAAGRYLGLTNLATAGAGVFGRLEGPLIDLLNRAQAGAWWGYTLIFILGALCMLISAWLLKGVPPAWLPEAEQAQVGGA